MLAMSQSPEAPPIQQPWIRRLPSWFGPLLALVLLIAVTIVFELATKGRSDFVSPENLMNIARQWSFVGIIAIGMTFVILLGGIDLSVGSLVAFLGGLGVVVMNALIESGSGDISAVLVGFAAILVVGGLAGLLNGLLVTIGRLAPFVATLGGLAAYRSLALAMADGGEFRSESAGAFAAIGTGGIPIPFTNIAPRAPEPIPLLFPWPVLIFIAAAIVASVTLRYTRFGRHILAIGSNAATARLCGVPVRRVKAITYALLGLATGLAALLLASRMNSVSSSGTGILYELDVIAAVVIGGTSMRGGRGTILGTVIGVFILGVVGNMLNLLQVSPYLQGLVKGIIIIAAVLIQRSDERE